MAHEVLTHTDFQFTETKFLRDVADAIHNATDNLIELSSDLDEIDLRDAVEKGAHLEAINFVTERAEEMIISAFMQAIFDTVEYNHELFIGRSQEAIQAHWQNILYVVPNSPGSVFVEADFSVLGNIETYAAAAAQARETLGFKMTASPESRSIYWARNIYGVDREGGTIGKSISRGIDKSQNIDITSSYLGKWTTTVQTRLSFIEPGQAPWWYILNYGNMDAFSESQGMPYPVVQPTHFVGVLEMQVHNIFNRIYRESLQGWEEWYADNLADDFNLDDFDNFDNIGNVIEPELVKQIEHQEERKPSNKTIGFVKQDGKIYEQYVTSKGKLGQRYSLSKN